MWLQTMDDERYEEAFQIASLAPSVPLFVAPVAAEIQLSSATTRDTDYFDEYSPVGQVRQSRSV